jgi:deoxyribonuclease-4
MLIGAQVRQTGGFLAALGRAEAMGAEVAQLFVQNNRQWRPPISDATAFADYREAAAASTAVAATVCHAPYLINVISPDPDTRSRSGQSLIANLEAATALGALGLVLHPGSHRGVGEADALRRVAECVVAALDAAERSTGSVCQLLLENTAGGGATVGRTFGELAAIISATGSDARIGVCVDTQHLWASGVSFATLAEADRIVRDLRAEIGLDRVRCIHLNDSKVEFASNHDRHENLGQGLIGEKSLASLIGHPDLQHVPAVLEVPGLEGGGPGRADLLAARRIHRRGRAAWRRAAATTRGASRLRGTSVGGQTREGR